MLRSAEAYADEHDMKLHTEIRTGDPAQEPLCAAARHGAHLLT